jgi:RNA polymerase sigma-70 factor (ECF subfamily)
MTARFPEREGVPMPADHPEETMAPASADELAARYGEYLRDLARLQVDPHLHALVDPSGVAQEALWKACQAWPDFEYRGEAPLRAWLRTILERALLDEMRKVKAQKRVWLREQSLERALEASSSAVSVWLADPGSSPSDRARRAEDKEALQDALCEMPRMQRQVLVWRYYHGWSHGEIAEHLGSTRVAVAGLLKRGLRALRARLGEGCG